MTKTRSQSIKTLSIKEEEDSQIEEKHATLLSGIGATTKTKITKKRRTSKVNPSVTPVKLEDESDNKRLIKRRRSTKQGEVTQEQINQLISYVVNDGMTVTAATRKVDLSKSTGRRYYTLYSTDPEHKIPKPWKRTSDFNKHVTYDQVKSLIGYVVNDNMTMHDASAKVNMSVITAYKYYSLYKKDPERNIPVLKKRDEYYRRLCSYDEVKALIGYIENDKMSIAAAARKANMNVKTGFRYYNMYKKDPENKIRTPVPKRSEPITHDRVKEFIDCIENDGMSMADASDKANISYATGYKYYKMYKNDAERKIPACERVPQSYTYDQIKTMIDLIVIHGMSLGDASDKVNMKRSSSKFYYLKYLHHPNHEIPTPRKKSNPGERGCNPDQIKNLITYLVNDKTPLPIASAKVNMAKTTAQRYYSLYLNDPNHNIPASPNEWNISDPSDQQKELIRCIVDDKMSIKGAAKKVKLSYDAARRYYVKYLKVLNHEMPTRRISPRRHPATTLIKKPKQ